jgi:hypothetical protein
MPRERYTGRDGDRVQTRAGVPGIVYRCRGQRGPYFKARLQTGEWVWPDQVIAQSSGPYLRTCGECGIDFRSEAANSHTCPNCVARESRSQGHDRDWVGSATFSRMPAAKKFQPAPVTVSATPEQRERIDRGRVSDDADVPY